MDKIQQFADKIKEHRQIYFNKVYPNYPLNCLEHELSVRIIPGKKYTKVCVGDSGKFMIDEDGNIFGIKAYGIIHKGHHYGTLDTIEDYFWGNYYPQKKVHHA